jgi:hypothetical protein
MRRRKIWRSTIAKPDPPLHKNKLGMGKPRSKRPSKLTQNIINSAVTPSTK